MHIWLSLCFRHAISVFVSLECLHLSSCVLSWLSLQYLLILRSIHSRPQYASIQSWHVRLTFGCFSAHAVLVDRLNITYRLLCTLMIWKLFGFSEKLFLRFYDHFAKHQFSLNFRVCICFEKWKSAWCYTLTIYFDSCIDSHHVPVSLRLALS